MKKTMYIGLIAAAMMASSAAFAADLTRESEVPVFTPSATSNWSGPYVSVRGGYGHGNSQHEHQNVNNFGGPGGTYNNSGDNGIYGAAVGYNHEFKNHVVVGVEGAIRSGINETDHGRFEKYNNNTSTKSHYVAEVTGKVGYSFGKVMPYVKGGWAGANIETSQNYHPAGLAPTTWSDSKFRSGYVVGAGVDYAINDRVSVGVEYDYYDFGRSTYSGNDSSGRLTKISGHNHEQTVMATLNFKF